MTPAVTPDPTQQPDPQVQPTPAPQPPVGPASANAVAPPAAAPPAAAQDDPNTHGWRSVLKGALSGLEEHLKGAGKGLVAGGIPGAVIGAVDPQQAERAAQMQKAQRESKMKFADAQAASQVADAHLRDAQREQLPKALQMQQDELDQRTAQMWITAGVYPEIVIPNTPDGAHAAADQLMKKYGAVPSLVYLHMGNEIVGFNPDSLASNSAVLTQVNNFQKVTGGPAYNPATLKNAPNKTQLTQDAAHLFSPTFPGMDKAQGMISQYDGYIAKVKLWPDGDSDKIHTLDKLQSAKDGLASAYNKRLEDQNKQAAIRGEAAQNAKAIEVVDPETNVAHFVSAGEAKAKGLTSSATAAKSEAKIAQLEDMQLGSKTARKAVEGLKNGLSPENLVKMTAALRSDSPSYIDKAKDALISGGLTDDQTAFVTAILNLQERALSLRSIGGQGQGSETQREAIVRLLPGLKDLGNPKLMRSKLDAFDQQVSIYFKNIPRVNTKTGSPAAEVPPPADEDVITHVSSDGKWAWNGTAWIANPKK